MTFEFQIEKKIFFISIQIGILLEIEFRKSIDLQKEKKNRKNQSILDLVSLLIRCLSLKKKLPSFGEYFLFETQNKKENVSLNFKLRFSM